MPSPWTTRLTAVWRISWRNWRSHHMHMSPSSASRRARCCTVGWRGTWITGSAPMQGQTETRRWTFDGVRRSGVSACGRPLGWDRPAMPARFAGVRICWRSADRLGADGSGPSVPGGPMGSCCGCSAPPPATIASTPPASSRNLAGRLLVNALAGEGRHAALLCASLLSGRWSHEKHVVVETAPTLSSEGRVEYCYACPNATVRAGILVPPCLADALRDQGQDGSSTGGFTDPNRSPRSCASRSGQIASAVIRPATTGPSWPSRRARR